MDIRGDIGREQSEDRQWTVDHRPVLPQSMFYGSGNAVRESLPTFASWRKEGRTTHLSICYCAFCVNACELVWYEKRGKTDRAILRRISGKKGRICYEVVKSSGWICVRYDDCRITDSGVWKHETWKYAEDKGKWNIRLCPLNYGRITRSTGISFWRKWWCDDDMHTTEYQWVASGWCTFEPLWNRPNVQCVL